MTTTLRFFKLDNRWYADVPNHTLDSGTGNVIIEMANRPTGRDICHLRMLNHNQWGATYSVNGVDLGVPTLWICNVTHDVFGEHPRDIYIQSIR